jgi:F0F1-type ATP synthase assembly protein I
MKLPMGKAAAKPKTTTTEDNAQEYLDVFAAKSRFFSATLNMGWRLAITVLVPLVAGIKIDQHFKTSPSYTLAGFMLAVAGGAAVVWSSVKEVNQEQLDMEAEAAKTRKTTKKGAKV